MADPLLEKIRVFRKILEDHRNFLANRIGDREDTGGLLIAAFDDLCKTIYEECDNGTARVDTLERILLSNLRDSA